MADNGLSPERSQPLDASTAIRCLANVEEIGESENTEAIRFAGFDAIDALNEFIGRQYFFASTMSVHTVEIKSAALNSAYSRLPAAPFDVCANVARPFCVTPKDLVIGHHFENIRHGTKACWALAKNLLRSVVEICEKKRQCIDDNLDVRLDAAESGLDGPDRFYGFVAFPVTPGGTMPLGN